jgi:F-type H+-transporting ATPase subunit b
MFIKRLIVFAGIFASSLPALAAEGAGGSMLIEPAFGLSFWTLLTFLLLLLLLGKFAWGPLIAAIKTREDAIRGDIDDARKQRDDAAAMLAEQKELNREALRERAEAVAAGQKDAERVKAEIVEEARQQREQLLKQAREQIEAETRQAKTELRATVADLTVLAAEKLLRKNLDDATQKKLVEDYLSGLERSEGDASSTH